MLIFKKARDGTLEIEGLKTIAQSCDVSAEGVKGAKSFFEAKANELSRASKFEQEIKGESCMTLILHIHTIESHILAHLRGTGKEEEGIGRSRRKEESIQGESFHVSLVFR